jgi:hypothetical protein
MRTLYEPDHTRTTIDRCIGRIAGAQHGVFTRLQAAACGATRAAIAWRLRVGRWERLYPSVYVLAGLPRAWRQDAIAACLHFGPGAAVAFRSAAVIRGLAASRDGTVMVLVSRSRNRRGTRGVSVRSSLQLIAEEDITTVDGIPVTSVPRTLLDLATGEPAEELGRVLDEALRRRLISLRALDGWLKDPRRTRHRGRLALQRLVDERMDIGVTESPLETRFLKLLRRAGLPAPVLQHVVRDGARFVGRVDFAYPVEKVAVEVDGFRYHADRRAFDDDRARANDLLALGWVVLRITAKHMAEDPRGVAAWVRRALSRYS